jgi:hypothetical protein
MNKVQTIMLVSWAKDNISDLPTDTLLSLEKTLSEELKNRRGVTAPAPATTEYIGGNNV